MNRFYLIFISFIVLFFTGCGTKIELAKFAKAPMLKSKYLPTKEQMRAKKTRVLITKFDENSIRGAINANLGVTLSMAIEKELNKANSVEIIQRSDNSINLKKEIEASELSKELGVDTGAAEYLISGKVGRATFSYRYIPAKRYKTSKGKIQTIPAKHEYKACTSGVVNILQFPSMNSAKSISFSNCSLDSERANSSHGYKSEDSSLMARSASGAIHRIRKILKNFFSLKGYILEKRVNGDDVIFLTTLGANQGAKESKDVEVYSIRDVKNPITGKVIKQATKIGKGEISNQITPDTSWVVLDELNMGEEAKIGDYIKIIYKGFFD